MFGHNPCIFASVLDVISDGKVSSSGVAEQLSAYPVIHISNISDTHWNEIQNYLVGRSVDNLQIAYSASSIICNVMSREHVNSSGIYCWRLRIVYGV